MEPGKRLQLAEQMRRRELNDGDEVMHQGELGESMFVIAEGECAVWIEDELGRREVAVLSRGQFFGAGFGQQCTPYGVGLGKR